MSNQLTPFNFEGANVQVIKDENNEPWFLAKDICAILGYTNVSQTISDNCVAKGISKRYTPTSGGNQELIYINEGNFYRLIVKSNKPEAERFESWVCDEVLPQIRKTGSYSTQQKRLTANEILAQSAMALVEHDKRLAATEHEVKKVVAKVEQTASRVEQISVDLRNGVPRGFISKKNARRMYSQGLSNDVFERALTAYNVPTQKYVHYAEGHQVQTFAYQEDHIPTAIAHFIRDLEQKTSCQCFSRVLNKRVNYVKIPNYGLKGGASTGVSNHV